MYPTAEEPNAAQDQTLSLTARWLTVSNLVVATLLATLSLLALQSSHRANAAKAQDATESIAVALSQTLAAELRRIDMALLTVRASMARKPVAVDDLRTLLDDQLVLVPWVDSLRVTDAAGIVRHGRAVGPGANIDLSDWDFFRRAQSEVKDELIVSEPVFARINQKWVLVLARRLQQPDGTFAGVIYANVSTEAFRQRFAEVDIGATGAISLRTASRQLVARHAPSISEPPAIGSTKVSRDLEAALLANPNAGFYVTPTALDGIERMSSYRAVDDYPLMVLVGLSTADYFAAWRKQAWQIALLFATAVLIMFGASFIVLRSRRRENASALELANQGLRNRALLRAASDGVQVLDRNGRVQEVSDSLAAMLSRDRSDLIGQHVSGWDTHFTADEINGWLAGLPMGEARRFKSTYRRGDGVTLDVEVQALAIRVNAQELIYCSVRDITERKRLTQKLLTANQELNDLYENAPCAYYSLDADGVIIRMNQVGLGWIGCSRDEVVGKATPNDFLDAAGRAQFRSLFPRFVKEGRVDNVEFDLVPRRGERRRVRMSALAVYGADGHFARTRSVMHDVTALQLAEQVRLKSAELEAENRHLREVSRVKRAFLSNVSHEMRTPLNAVIGFADLLRSGAIRAGTPKFDQYLDQVKDSGSKLLTLIDSVLQVAQAESGRLETNAEHTSIRHVIDNVLSVFDVEARGKKIAIESSVESQASFAFVDPLRLEQSLSSYLSNAVKFTASGGHVTVRARALPDRTLRLEVQDSGIGIRPADVPRLFSDFQQLSEGNTKLYGGLGIGLALTKRIIESQGGSVSVSSEPGRGSVFGLELPGVLAEPVDA